MSFPLLSMNPTRSIPRFQLFESAGFSSPRSSILFCCVSNSHSLRKWSHPCNYSSRHISTLRIPLALFSNGFSESSEFYDNARGGPLHKNQCYYSTDSLAQPKKPTQKLYLTTLSKASITRSFSQEDVNAFASLSGDRNPIHIDRSIQNSFIKERYGVKDKALVHGMLVASLISTVAGMVTPGEGSIYLKQTLNFEKPVFVGDVLEAKVRLTRVVRSDLFAFETIVFNKTRQWNAITGDSLVMHPKVKGGKSPLDILLFWFEGLPEVEQQLRLVLGEKRMQSCTASASRGLVDGNASVADGYSPSENVSSSTSSLPVGKERWFGKSDQVQSAITMNFKDTAQTLASSEEILDYWLQYMIPKHPECTMLATVILFSAMSKTLPDHSPDRVKYEQLAVKIAKKAVYEQDHPNSTDLLKLDVLKQFLMIPLQES